VSTLVPVAGAGVALLPGGPRAVRARVRHGDGEERREAGRSAPPGPWGIPVFPASPRDAAAAYRGALDGPPTLLLDVYA